MLTLFLFFFQPQISPAELISTGVGMVRGQVVTSRQVQADHLIEKVLYLKEKPKALSIDSKAFGKASQDLLLESVVSMEAQNFNLVQIPTTEIEQAERQVLKAVSGNHDWKALRVTPTELKKNLQRKLQAKKFVQFRAQSSVLPVTDVDAEKYFTENRQKFGNLPFENFKENIKSYLSRTQVDQRLKDWYDLLLNKYQVKNLIAEI